MISPDQRFVDVVRPVRFGKFYFIKMVFDILRTLDMFTNLVFIEVFLTAIASVAEAAGVREWLILLFIILLELLDRF